MNLTIPHKFKPRAYQLPVLKAMDKGIKRAVCVWHRRSGKDKTLFNLMVKKAFERVGTYFYLFPTYTQGKKILWKGMDKSGFKFTDHIPPELIEKKNDTEMYIELKNGSVIQIVGTDQIDNIVGTNPIGCVFSEYSLQNPKAWDLIRPILAENGGWAIFNFTPRGKNHGWKILQQARQSDDWFHQVLSVEDTKAISEDVLEKERQEMPQEMYEQEYLCKFIDGAASFFKRIDDNLWEGNLEPQDQHSYTLGVDLAKFQDWTVITPFCLNNFRVGKQDAFNKIDYSLQKAKIESYYHQYRRGGETKIRIDSTGVGEPVFDDLSAKGLNIEPFRFSSVTRTNLLNNLAMLLEQGRIKIPNCDILVNELKSFQYVLKPTGRVAIEVPDGVHDDRVMSLALAVWECPHWEIPTKMAQEYDLYGKQSFE